VRILTEIRGIHQIWCTILSTSNVIAWLGCLFLALSAPSSALAAQGSAPPSQLESLYKANRFPEALQCCETAIKAHPLDMSLRYWHASILLKLQRVSEARQEYEYVLTYSTNKTEQDYARKACQSLPPVVSNANGGSPAVTPTVNPSADRITRQADADSSGVLMDGAARQTYFRNKGALDANYTNDLRAVDAMQRATIKVGNTYVPRYTADEIQFQRNQATDKANQLRTENEARGAEALQLAQQKAFETQAAAANLAAQINSAPKTGFHLREEGTSLYVRQYNAPPSNSSFTPNPATVTINDSADAQRGRFDSPMQATARALDPALQKQLDVESRKAVKSNVYGRINPPDQNSNPH
jgi:hypothetical protein